MEFGERAKRESKPSSKMDEGDRASKYPLALQFYDLPPTDTISLMEFGELAVERLKVLRILEKLRLKHPRHSKEFKEALLHHLRKEGLVGYIKKTPEEASDTDPADYADRRKDHVSHFILRLAYCKTEELRRWFVRQETDLFACRFENESRAVVAKFLASTGVSFKPISESEKHRICDKVRQVSSVEIYLSDSTEFYKVPFVDVLDLVAKRRVYLEKGFAFLKPMEMSHVLANLFRSSLSRSLAVTARALPSLDEETRLMPVLDSLHASYVGKDFAASATDGRITRLTVDSLCHESFPFCMRRLHQALRDDHHLRHGGRLQYMLFLKGIGMSLEEVLGMWREEFVKIMDGDKFDKQYAYSIRHSFGKEGKRVSYTPYSCAKIISSSAPGNGDHHGCPFKHSDRGVLKEQLSSLKVPSSGVREILDLVEKGHYQIACTRHFELTRNSTLDRGINHPNEFFEESYKLARGIVQPRQDSGARHAQVTRVFSSQTISQATVRPGEPSAFEDDDFDSVMASLE